MDPRAILAKLKGLKALKEVKIGGEHQKLLVRGALVLGLLVILVSGFKHASKKGLFTRFVHATGLYRLAPSYLMKTYATGWVSFLDKVDSLKRSELENDRLKLENANLRLQLEGVQFDCTERRAAKTTHQLEQKLAEQTGSKVGQTLATIGYRPPLHLSAIQLYTLGVSYFKAREDEKAAVILTFLTGLDDNPIFKTSKNFLATGVSWYRLENFELADQFFDHVLKAEEEPETVQYQAQARLWKGLVAQRVGKHTKSQYWLREILDHHPHSTEAGWINSKEAGRATASEGHH